MEPSTQASNTQDDPMVAQQAKNLTKAIFQHESGTKYDAVGDAGTSHGAGQWQAGTWSAQAKDVLGDANAPMTQANQSVVAQGTIRKLIKSGKNAAQIAAIWNSGNDQDWQNKVGTTTINGQHIAYNVPKYVKSVTDLYQQYKQQGGNTTGGFNPTPYSGAGSINFSGANNTPTDANKSDSSFIGDASKTIGDAGTGVSNAVTDTMSGKINPLSGLIQGAGAIAGGASGLINNSLEHAPIVGGVYKGIEGLIGQGAQAAANTGVGQSAIKGYQDFSTAHPEVAGDINGAINIATAVPLLKGLGVAKDAVTGGVSTALRGGADAVLDTVGPKLTAGETADALKSRGTVNKGLLRETQLAPDPRVQEVADAVKQHVPKFDASKPLLHNITQVQTVVSKMAKDLKQAVIEGGTNRAYPTKELIARLKAIEKPDLIASDTTLNNVYNRLIKRVGTIAEAKGGKVSNLLDLRQEFDALVKKQYPNLYKSETLTPLRQGVKDIRNTITNFTAEKLPTGNGLKESLLTQHKLLTAIENMAEKASKGSTREIGTNAISRLAGRHPKVSGLLKLGAKAAVEGTGIGAAMHLLN